MKKITIAALMFVPATFLTGCTIAETTYSPGYNNDYVYAVGYYGYRPYWTSYYSGGWGNVGYWRGYRAYSNRSWFEGRRW
ncbi:hypothetical protein Lnau_0294 [Legionella nautarum]|uniref:Lipoprotein n=1 Tax=Legionella nautarum TaxID=45070 RepID=A0A0W0X3F9_9GAMM|nr:hypothetical protein [Legionella nautarum]KTD39095.1 hypothetical protein Lnau_0294 [Legionella nautarum]